MDCLTSQLMDNIMLAHIDKFDQQYGRILDNPDARWDVIEEMNTQYGINTLHYCLTAALTPTAARDLHPIPHGLSQEQALQINRLVPDIVANTQLPGERLDRLTAMLSMSYDDAVRQVCAQYGIPYQSLVDLPEDHLQFVTVHTAAKEFFSRNSITGILHRVLGADMPPAVLIQGLGTVLRENRPGLWALITNPLLQITNVEREEYRAVRTMLDGMYSKSGAYAAARMRQGGKEWVQHTVREMMSRSTNPNYIAILHAAEQEAISLD